MPARQGRVNRFGNGHPPGFNLEGSLLSLVRPTTSLIVLLSFSSHRVCDRVSVNAYV